MHDLRFAVLGTAKIGRTVIPRIMATDGATVLGVASRSAHSGKQYASELSLSTSWDSYEAALDNSDVDAVYIPLPPSLHQEWVTKAAESGKHVLCEKPLARNVDEARAIRKVCQQNNIVLLDGVMWYHTARAVEIKRIVDSDQLGQLRQLTSVFTFQWDEFPLDNVRMQRELGGGSLLDLGWYCVGVTLWLYDALPIRVTARAEYHNDVDTKLNGWLEFSDGRFASIECGFDTVKRRWFELAGTRENLVCDDFTRPWDDSKPRFWTHDNDGQPTEHLIPHPPQEECMAQAFCELVRTDTVNHHWLDLSINTQLVCDALAESARTGRTVSVATD